MPEEPLQIGRLRNAFLGGRLSASELIDRVLARIAKWDDPALWIARPSDAALSGARSNSTRRQLPIAM